MPVLSTAGAASAAGFGVPETFYPGRLFAAGEQGAWYDPSDLTTLFQDSAGTTPVTGVEQVVGLMKDKSGRGNHATSTGSARPTLSALVNMLTYTEQFDNAYWAKNAVTITADAVVAPDGTTTADNMLETATTAPHLVYINGGTFNATANIQYTASIFAKPNGRNFITVIINWDSGNYCSATFDVSSGTVTQTNQAGLFVLVSTSIVSAANGFYQCFITGYRTSGGAIYYSGYCASDTGTFTPDGYGRKSYAGDATKGLYIWGADFRPTGDAVGSPSYQRVAAAGIYNTVGFPYYLLFSGAQGMSTPANVNFSGTDKATVWAGLRKLSDAARGMVVELNTTGTNDFKLSAPDTTGGAPYNNYGPRISGTTGSGAFYVLPFVAPITNVVSVAYNLSGATNPDQVSVTVNNVAQSLAGVGTSMTGNFSNAPLYIGARNYPTTPSLYFNGRLYGLIVRGAVTSTDQLQKCVGWVNNKTKAY